MLDTKIKPIPKYILERILKVDKTAYPEQNGATRFYAYLTKNDGELVKVTVAVKNHKHQWYCKQCAVHGVHSDKCFIKDMIFFYIGGYKVGWYAEGLQKYQKWYEDKDWDYQDDNLFDPSAPIVNKEYLAKFPEYRYSAYGLYNNADIFKYLRLYKQYPQTEYLLKMGLKNLVMSTQILKHIGKDKAFCKWLIQNKDELAKDYHYVQVILRAYRTRKPLAELQAYQVAKLKLQHDENLNPIRELFKGNDLERFFSYIAKQDTNPNTYLDYLKACNHLGLDMTIDKNRFPHNFKRWHDIQIDEYATARAMEDAEERKELYKQFAAIAEKYLPLEYDKRNNFAVVIARSPADLIREGEVLHHCVGRMGYDQKFVREETLIFFIRNKDHVDTPFVTVEYSLKMRKILQCHGEHNSKPDDSVMNYINKTWLPFANRTIKKLAA